MKTESKRSSITKVIGVLALVSALGIIEGGVYSVAYASDEVKKDDPCCPQPADPPAPSPKK